MKLSAKAIRKQRHHKRFNQASKLNLVSLMDIFTILVFFLIVNQSEVRVLQNAEKLQLPVSVAEQLPTENVVIAVLHDMILVQERTVWQRAKGRVNARNDGIQPPLTEDDVKQLVKALKTELTYLSTKRVELTELELEKGRGVTIIGDSSIEYNLLKQIMGVCAETDYRNMSLAVEHIADKTNTEGDA